VYGLLTSGSVLAAAPGFTLTSTSGRITSLASYRGHDVVLYFNEGVGCDACFYQMREFENHAAELAKAGITIMPIVMNPAGQVRAEMTAFGVRTPYLIDATGSVSAAYGVLGKGMHAGLPGHGFVLIDARGTERWYGEYPSMYLSTAGLIAQARAHV
jgi:peroxiredoxin